MISKKILLPVLIGSTFYLGACGGDDTPNAPVYTPGSSAYVPASSAVLPGSSAYIPASSAVNPLSSAVVPSSSSAAPVPASSATPAAYPALAATANINYAVNDYLVWQTYHYVTKDAESVYYASIAGDFAEVFPAAAYPAGSVGRVIWSAQTSYYKPSCSVDDASISTMKFRGCTVSEGIGYGMLLAYFNNDVATFNSLWNYTRGFRAYNNVKLMPWITKSFHWEKVDNSSATDADLDIATSLILMYYKTGIDAYLQDALTFVNAIWDMEVNPTTLLIYSGDDDIWKTATTAYNLSYFSPVAIRLFAQVDPAHNWQGVLDANYTYMQLVQSLGTGVFPDWSDASGKAVNPPNESAGKTPDSWTWYTFNKEAVRIPWRIAWDYYWYQDTRAAAILNKLNDFISKKASGDPDNQALSVNYSWDLSVGTDITKNTVVSSQWYGAWCATGIAGNAAWLNKCTTGMNAKLPSNTPSSYFSDILMAMYAALLNGLFVRPF